MSEKTRARQAALKARLVELAQAQIEDGGLASLKARDLAAGAGCSVGAIYNLFDDLNALVLEINGVTFRALGAHVTKAVQTAGPVSANARLVIMGQAYLGFAAQNTHLWRALFDIQMTTDGPVPAWYMESLGKLFSIIAEPLSDLFPEMTEQDLDLMTRALFSSVHGIVLLGLERRISAVPLPEIEKMIAQVIGQIGT